MLKRIIVCWPHDFATILCLTIRSAVPRGLATVDSPTHSSLGRGGVTVPGREEWTGGHKSDVLPRQSNDYFHR